MEIRIEKITDWDLVYKTALYTQGKVPTKQFPSEQWKAKTIKAQHSPLRALQFLIYIEDVPNFVLTHLSRHVHAQPYIRTMREDLTGVPSHLITRNTPNNGVYLINAQEFLSVSYQRLCFKASKETREAWKAAVNEMFNVEPLLAHGAVPNCVRLKMCPEYKPCAYNESLEQFEDCIKYRK